jgi:hypothetical protein
MNIEEIKFNINQSIENVFIIAKQSCTNSFSTNIKLIKRLVSVEDQKNDLKYDNQIKIEHIKKRMFISSEKLVFDIFNNQHNLIWIDFVLFNSSEKETIILVELIENKNSKDLNFHCCIMLPPGFIDNKIKFDINRVFDSDKRN